VTLGNPLVPTALSPLRQLNARARAGTMNLGLGQPEIDMPPALRELAARAIAQSRLGYTPNAGMPELREAIGRHYGLDAEGVLVSHGAQEGLMAFFTALLRPGDEVLLPDPGFLAYPTMVKMAGGKSVSYPLQRGRGGFAYDVDGILSRLTRKTRAVLICSPNNPSGTMLPAAERARLLRELERRRVFLVSDDVYAELAFREAYSPASADSEFAVTVNSWSKSLALTGWRIGFAHTRHPKLRAKLVVAHQYLTTCASAPAQALLLECLRQPKLYRSIVEGFRELYGKRLDLLLGLLPPSARPEKPQGGFYLFLPLGRRSDIVASEELLTKKNLLVVPGAFFGRRGRGWLRVSVAAPEAVLAEAGRILAGLF
jgi:aspartate aminotransferase